MNLNFIIEAEDELALELNHIRGGFEDDSSYKCKNGYINGDIECKSGQVKCKSGIIDGDASVLDIF
jgi:hypothetical protein